MKNIRIVVQEIMDKTPEAKDNTSSGFAVPGPGYLEVLFERRMKCKSLKRIFTEISKL